MRDDVAKVNLMIISFKNKESKQSLEYKINTLTINLEKIIELCLQDDRAAQEQLYHYTYCNLLNAVNRYVSEHNDAKWVFNMGMLKVFKALHSFKLGTNYLGFANTILVRTSIDFLRKKLNTATMISSIHENEWKEPESRLESALDKLNAEELMFLIKGLPEKERLIFSMFEIDGFSHREIEEITKINSNTSKWLLAKAKNTLKNKIIQNHNSKIS